MRAPFSASRYRDTAASYRKKDARGFISRNNIFPSPSDFTSALQVVMPSFAQGCSLTIIICLFGGAIGLRNLEDKSEKPSTDSQWAESTSPSHRVVTDVYFGGHRLAEVFLDGYGHIQFCNMFGDRALIGELLPSAPAFVVDQVDEYQMTNVVQQCAQRPQNAKDSYFPRLRDKGLQGALMFPGTKWCGAGNIATDYNDLGESWEADMCCREHDSAKESIPAFGAKRGIRNRLFYTMTGCEADKKFFNCLLNAQTFTAFSLGIGYFDLLRTKCYKYDRPTKCADKHRGRKPHGKVHCKRFVVDNWRVKKWRVYDPPNFFKAYFLAKIGVKGVNDIWTSETKK
uniref:Phospholipase A2 n=1 Tax=Rhipicephalus zambeziensis TaxID=60191 RepID=A0A224YDG5_9ACAR